MIEHAKITAAHRERVALVYVRQSHPSQVERNRESTTRQYQLIARAGALGWPQGRVRVIDDDLGVTANGVAERAGFAELTAEVALGRVGIVPSVRGPDVPRHAARRRAAAANRAGMTERSRRGRGRTA